MSSTATLTDLWTRRPGAGGAALLGTLGFLALHAGAGLPTLSASGGDNDSLLRLVEVRDLIEGQGWFDLHQYRMGPEGGFVMHWSRLVDAPIAALVLAGAALTGGLAMGESFALVVWPSLLFVAALFCMVRLAVKLGGAEAIFPAALIGAVSLHYTGVFAPGAIDHHNLQLVLTLAVALLLVEATARPSTVAAGAAGLAAAVSIGVAMEAVPYVAVAGGFVAAWLVAEPARARGPAAGFGFAFAGTALAIFLATVAPDAWSTVACDAFSLPQGSVAVLCGLGLATAALVFAPTAPAALRLGAVAMVIAAGLGALISFFPQCLADPYAGLDPRLRLWWLDAVTEAQPIWKVVAADPAMAAGHYGTPHAALVVLAASLRRRSAAPAEWLLALFLAAAFMVSLWQVRGSVFSVPLAAVPLGAMVASLRGRGERQDATATLKTLGAWLVSFSVVWSSGTAAVARAISPAGTVETADSAAAICDHRDDFAGLGRLPTGRVLAVSNLGAAILRHTKHSVLAGPYHRNAEGNLAALDALTMSSAAAEAALRRQGVTLVSVCRGEDESRMLAAAAPGGLLSVLLRGETPVWLRPLAGTGREALELFAFTGEVGASPTPQSLR